MTFDDLRPGDVFLMAWWLSTGPTPRAYMVVDQHDVGEPALTIVRLEEASAPPTYVRVSLLKEAQAHGEIRLLEILPR